MFFREKHHRIICVGSVSKDIFFPTDEGMVIDTPEDILSKQKVAFELGGKYRVTDRYESIGGVAANVACGLVLFGHDAATYSNIGDDDIGTWVKNEFVRLNMHTDLLNVLPHTKTDLSAIVVLTQNGERTIFHNRDANEQLAIKEGSFEHAEWVLVGALNGDWVKKIHTLLMLKDRYGFSLAYNPGQHNIREDAHIILDAVAQCDVLLLNKDEAIELIVSIHKETPRHQLEDEVYLLQTLSAMGAGRIGLTDGARGAWGYEERQYWHCPSFTVHNLVDSTGAGDAFGSGFIAATLEKKSVAEALGYGIINSGSVIGHYGAIAGLVDQQTIEKYSLHLSLQRLR